LHKARRAEDNSPAIYRWVGVPQRKKSRPGQKNQSAECGFGEKSHPRHERRWFMVIRAWSFFRHQEFVIGHFPPLFMPVYG
jgi:hypothetical protein